MFKKVDVSVVTLLLYMLEVEQLASIYIHIKRNKFTVSIVSIIT